MRIGYQYDSVQGPGAIGTLHTFLEASLTTWTVGPIYPFGSGSLERNYFVLKQGAHEVLVFTPNGTNSEMANSFYSGWYEGRAIGTNYHQPLCLAYSPTGGYESAFINGYDPYLQAEFWDQTSSSRVMPMQFWYDNDTSDKNLYFIENTESAEFFLYCGNASSGYGFFGVSENMVVNDEVPVDTKYGWKPHAMYRLDVEARTVTAYDALVYWDALDQTSTFLRNNKNPDIRIGSLRTIGSLISPDPLTGAYPTLRAPAVTEMGTMAGQLNPKLFREYPPSPSTFGKKIVGTGDDEVYVHIYTDLLTPWCSNLDPPDF